jgi:energy-coupling factor transporter transmembrane protein EcfT
MISIALFILLAVFLVICIVKKWWEWIILPILGLFILIMCVILSGTTSDDEAEYNRLKLGKSNYSYLEKIDFKPDSDGIISYNEHEKDVRWEVFGENNGSIKWRKYSQQNDWNIIYLDSEEGKLWSEPAGLIVNIIKPNGTWKTQRIVFNRKPFGLWQPLPKYNMMVILHTKE